MAGSAPQYLDMHTAGEAAHHNNRSQPLQVRRFQLLGHRQSDTAAGDEKERLAFSAEDGRRILFFVVGAYICLANSGNPGRAVAQLSGCESSTAAVVHVFLLVV